MTATAPRPDKAVHGGRRALRWVKRIVFGLLAFVVIAVGALLAVIHTDWGRDKIRGQIQSALASTFTGGGTLGRLDGSPFGELVLHDLVINGPDGKPAIVVKTVRLQLELAPLIHKRAVLRTLAIDDVDVQIKRNPDGSVQMGQLTKPGPSSGWAVELSDAAIRRLHVSVDRYNFDDINVNAKLALTGAGTLDTTVLLAGQLRERGLPLMLMTSVHKEGEVTQIPSLVARVGGIRVGGVNVSIKAPPAVKLVEGTQVDVQTQLLTQLAGTIAVDAPARAVEALAPQVQLPGDLLVAADVSSPFQPWTNVELNGSIAQQQLWAMLGVDLGTLAAHGVVSGSHIDVGRLTYNPETKTSAVTGTGSAVVAFAVHTPAPGKLPVGVAVVTASGRFEGAPYANVGVVANSDGTTVSASVGATGPAARARLLAVVKQTVAGFTLQTGRVVAETSSPERTSQGAAPVTGAIAADLTASGTLTPALDLAVAGTVSGRKLAAAGVTVGTMKLAIDAQHIPARPVGRAELQATNVQRNTFFLRNLAVTAGTQADGKIAVAVRTRPRQDPWQVDVDALVDLGTPSRELRAGAGDPVTIEILRHFVKTANSGEWKGNSGVVTIGSEHVTLARFATHNGLNKIEAGGEYWKAGRREGDLAAHVAMKGLSLKTLIMGYAGTLDATADVTRTNGLFAGTVDVSAKEIALAPLIVPFNLQVHVKAAPGSVQAKAGITSPIMGDISVAADVAGPRDITNVKAWQALPRSAIRTGQLKLDGIHLSRAAALFGLDEKQYEGLVDGQLDLSATQLGGQIRLHDVVTPQIRGVGKLTAELAVTQTGPHELTPTIVATLDNVGKVNGRAVVEIPDRLFAPASWRAIGKPALKSANLYLQEVTVDPTMFARFGIVTDLQGKVSAGIEVGPALSSVTVQAGVRDFHGAPIQTPISLGLNAKIDAHGSSAVVRIGTMPQQLTAADRASPVVLKRALSLIELTTQLPITMAQVVADPAVLTRQPLNVKATIPSIPASQLLGIFGRTDVQSGTISGTVDFKGVFVPTVATAEQPAGRTFTPDIAVHLAGADIIVIAGPGGRPVPPLELLAIEGHWDGSLGHLDVSGTQGAGLANQGGGALHVVADAKRCGVGTCSETQLLESGSATIEAKTFDLTPVLAFAPGQIGAARGVIDGNLKVVGTSAADAMLAGKLHLTNVHLPIAPQIGTLRRATIDIDVGANSMTVGLDGTLGAGTIKVAGKFGIAGARPTSGEVTATLRKVSPIGTIEPNIDADVKATFDRQPEAWVANVTISHGNVVVPDERNEALKEIGAPDDMIFLEDGVIVGENGVRKSKVAPPQQRAAFIANITLLNTYVKSTEVRAVVHGKLRMELDANASVALTGRIEADRGDLDLFGRRYLVDRAAVRFDGTVDPLLDVAITHDFPDVTTVTQVRGRVSAPEIILASNPGTYSQGQLLGFLLGGEPSGEPADGNPRDKAASAGASLIGNQIGGYVKDQLPFDVDVLKYEAATATSSQAVTVGSWLTSNLFLAYKQRFQSRPDENTGEAELEYYLSRRVIIEATVGDKSRNGIDLLWRHRY